ncbi:Holliday junction branch migration protein RuvA [uncultured Sphaerochaeta sp.]|uniref:Holliday junction branch migration protein RuvA n=1 Tax=uncultured Sphaerochaeta sp. TaxID=886478 RepID=UPI002A0A5AF5|nr:Holliday junction branch migration protein RuvA [uncultured Sphaerochaeta sp.]
MINALIGDIVTIEEGTLFLRCGHIEYTLSVSSQTASTFSNLSLDARRGVRVMTVLVHREDSMSLFGFSDADEREAFLQLQTVSGIGSKQALKILSGINVRNLAEALDSGNLKLLSSIPGIGPKTGQKMILALRNVLVLDEDKGRSPNGTRKQAHHPYSDIINALVDMGYDRRLVEETVDKVTENQASELEKMSHHDAEEHLFRLSIKLLG